MTVAPSQRTPASAAGGCTKPNGPKSFGSRQHQAFGEAAPDELRFAPVLALWTGQRQDDLIKLTWSQYDGTHIRLPGQAQGPRFAAHRSVLKTELDSRCPEKPEGGYPAQRAAMAGRAMACREHF
ncbi:hypothetical protein ACIPUD_15500 [Bradyrhizobium sp. CAR08]